MPGQLPTVPAHPRPTKLADWQHAVIVLRAFAAAGGVRTRAGWADRIGVNRQQVLRWLTARATPAARWLWVMADIADCDIVLVPRKPARPPRP